jgi:uncharacterized membrane protein
MPAFKSLIRYILIPIVLIAALLAFIMRDKAGYMASAAASLQLHPHAPDLSLVAQQSLIIQIHLYVALAAIALGGFQIVLPKGTPIHRVMGWTWLSFMAVIAGTSLFIKLINPGHFSLIHILSVVVLIQIPRIIWFARKGDIKSHKRAAISLYIGALIVAGLFTFMPGRLMWHLFLG